MKENDGRAARRTRGRAGVAFLLLLLGMLAVVVWKQRAASRDARPVVRGTVYPPPLPVGIARQSEIEAPASNTDPHHAALLRGELTLVDLQVQHVHADGHTYKARGTFCAVDWAAHKVHPSVTPMFRDVRAQSPACADQTQVYVVADLPAAIAAMKAYDSAHPDTVQVLALAGVVFQESRCGSTLVANLLQAADPVAHRVYAEAPPPLQALTADERYTADQLAPLLRDVIYSMSRSRDMDEQRVFFKFQSAATRRLPTWQRAFASDHVPWLFVFRAPVQILMSHFANGPQSVGRANCARSHRQPPPLVTQRLVQAGRHTWTPHSHQEQYFESYCAASLATFTETVLAHVNEDAFPVAYADLPDLLWTTLLPHVFGIPLDASAVARMQATSLEYSKGRGAAGRTFVADADAKEAQAWPAVQEAAATFLQASFDQLVVLAEERKAHYKGAAADAVTATVP